MGGPVPLSGAPKPAIELAVTAGRDVPSARPQVLIGQRRAREVLRAAGRLAQDMGDDRPSTRAALALQLTLGSAFKGGALPVTLSVDEAVTAVCLTMAWLLAPQPAADRAALLERMTGRILALAEDSRAEDGAPANPVTPKGPPHAHR